MKCDHVGAARYTSTDKKTQICYRCGHSIVVQELTHLRDFKTTVSITDTEPGNYLVRKSDPETSQAAAWMNPGRRNSQRWRLAKALADRSGMTWEQAAEAAGIDAKSSPWRRLTELRERGIIEVVGIGTTSLGAKAQLYRLTDDGRRSLG